MTIGGVTCRTDLMTLSYAWLAGYTDHKISYLVACTSAVLVGINFDVALFIIRITSLSLSDDMQAKRAVLQLDRLYRWRSFVFFLEERKHWFDHCTIGLLPSSV